MEVISTNLNFPSCSHGNRQARVCKSCSVFQSCCDVGDAAQACRKKLGLVCPEGNGCFGGRNICLCLTVSC